MCAIRHIRRSASCVRLRVTPMQPSLGWADLFDNSRSSAPSLADSNKASACPRGAPVVGPYGDDVEEGIDHRLDPLPAERQHSRASLWRTERPLGAGATAWMSVHTVAALSS